MSIAICEKCGGNDRLNIHCKDGNIENLKEDNIVILCYGCWKAAHAEADRKRIAGKRK